MVATVALFAAFLIYFAGGDKDESGGDTTFWVVLVPLLLGIGMLRLVVDAENITRRGQTWGMRALRLRAVEGSTGGPVSRGQAWGRVAFASFISSLCLGFGFWWALFDHQKRALHDVVCGTVLIDER